MSLQLVSLLLVLGVLFIEVGEELSRMPHRVRTPD